MTDRTCQTCCYRSDAFTSACTNADSPMCADFVCDSDSCDVYEEERTVIILGKPVRYPASLTADFPTIVTDAERRITNDPECVGLKYINANLDCFMEMPEDECQ